MQGPVDAGASRKQELIFALRLKLIPIKVDTDLDWTADYAKAFNNRLGDPPDVVVVPASVKHITDAVVVANEKGAKVQARSGGHSYIASSSRKRASYTMMVVDLRKFRDVQYIAPNLVQVGAGVRLGRLALKIHRSNGHALAHGTCPSVGVGGHFTHGGYGYTSRAWGLAMDQIVSMDVVTADGCLVKASESENEHLFWALRGAAASFGIVVRFCLVTRAAPEHALRFSAEYPDIAADYSMCTKAVMALQEVAEQDTFEKEVSFGIFIGPERFGLAGVLLHKMDHENTGVSRLFEALTGLRKAHTDDTTMAVDGAGESCPPEIKIMSWIGLLKELAGDSSLKTPEPFTDSRSFYANSLMAPLGFCAQALENYFNYIKLNSPAPIRWFAIMDLWGGHESRISKPGAVPPSACRRDAFWVVQNYGYVDDGAAFPSEGVEFIEGMNRAMARAIPGGGTCANYPDSELSRERACRSTYGSSYGRLRELKKVLDPHDVFHHTQSIGTWE